MAMTNAEVANSWPQAARENDSRIASADDAENHGAPECLAEAVEQDALQRQQRRQDQERAEHVRILEEAARAAVQRQEIVAAGDEVEIAEDAGERGDDGADDVAAARAGRAGPCCRPTSPSRRTRLCRHVPRRRQPVGHGSWSSSGDRRDRIADVDQEQQQQQRHEQRPDLQPGGEEDDDRRQRCELVGLGSMQTMAPRGADEPQQRVLQRLHAGRGRVGAKLSVDLKITPWLRTELKMCSANQ